jgi:hypothetical protein
MTASRLGLWTLVLVLATAPCLGFTAGHVSSKIGPSHYRPGDGQRAESGRVAWKSLPGVTSPAPPPQVQSLLGSLSLPPLEIVAFRSLRPPFVPPRG